MSIAHFWAPGITSLHATNHVECFIIMGALENHLEQSMFERIKPLKKFDPYHWTKIWEYVQDAPEGETVAAQARLISQKLGCNETQTRICITQIMKMRVGERFSAYTNDEATRYFLQQIERRGWLHLERALRSLQLSRDYAKDRWGAEQLKMKELIDEYTARLQLIDQGYAERKAFELEVETANRLPSLELQRLASRAMVGPAPVKLVTTWIRLRNPAVVAQRLRIADGICESCSMPAPFRRADSTAYLEVHHIEPLAEDGPDIVENTIALCPACHRAAHYAHTNDLPYFMKVARN